MDLSLSKSGKNPTAPAQAPGKQGYILYRGAWRLFESSLWFELEDGSDYLTAYAKPGSRPVLGIPLAKASIASPADKGKKPKAGKENKRCKLHIKTESGKEHTLVLTSEEQRDDWIKALTLARDLALSGDQLVKQWRDNGCQVCVGDASEAEEAGGAEEILEPTPENTEALPPAALNARLEDAQGKATSLKQILVGKRPVVMVLVRHFGCVLCRLILAKLRAVSPQLLRLGASIVVIGNGSPEMARNFKKQFDFNGKIYVDQLRTVYTALGCRRGFRFALSPSAMLRAKEAFGMGFSQGPVQGDTWQLGGLFVLGSPAGNILFAHNERFGGDSANLPDVISTVERHVRTTDPWTMVPEPHPAWPSTITTSPSITASAEHLIETSASPQGSFLVRKPSERNAGSLALTYEATLDRQCLSPHYSQSLAPFPHQNFVSTEGVVSFEEPSPDKDSRAVIRTSESDFRVVVPAAYCGSAKEALQYLTDCTPVFAKATFVRVEGPKFVEALMAYEVSNLVRVYKFGVILLRDHQVSEDMWYANGTSPAFETFVSALGEKVALKGWQMYSGGLDTSGNRTGEFSRYTTFSGLEIMLHVAPYIPNTQADSQCLDRKRHIGNDVVMIVFKEGRTAFNPSVVLSRFNHVFLVVEPKPGSETDADPSYIVSMCCKLGVPYFSPSIPAEIKRSQLRDFLLAKAINGERAAMDASSFRDRLGKYRHVAIESLVKTYIGKDGRAAEGFSFLANSNAVNAPLSVRGTSPSVSGPPGAVVRPASPQLSNSAAAVAPLSPSSSSVSASVNAAAPESPLAESRQHATIGSHASRFGSTDSKINRAGHSGSAPAQVANPQPVVPPLSARKEPSTELPAAPLSPVLTDAQKLAVYTERVTQVEDLTARMRMLLLGGEANLFSIEMVMLQIHTLSVPLSRPPPQPSALPPMQTPPRATSPRPSPLANGMRPADRSSASSASTGSDSNPNPNPNPLNVGPPSSPAPAPPLLVRPVSPARSAPPRVAAALIGVGRTSQSGEPRAPQ